MTLDVAYPDERDATRHLEQLLGAKVTRLRVRKLDLVHDTTLVDVCFTIPSPRLRGDANNHPGVAANSGAGR